MSLAYRSVPTTPQPTEAPPAVSRSRLPTLTGARFLAALAVFLFHAALQNFFASPATAGRYYSIFHQGGWAGVSFFFVLSGFVLTWSARPGDTARSFWRRRLVKIYPNHLVTFAAAAVLLATVAKVHLSSRAAAANLLLVHSWFPQIDIRISYNDVTWSLSCELAFYLSFPLLNALISRIDPRRLWWWAGGVAAVAVAVVPAIADLMPTGPVYPGLGLTKGQFWFVLQCPPVRMLDFLFGMILARLVMSGRRMPLGFGGAVALTLAAYVLAPMFPATLNVVAVTFVPLGLLVAAAAASDVAAEASGGRRSWLASPLMVRLGEISFAFYMCHRIVLAYGDHLIGTMRSFSTPVALLVLAGFLAAALAVSWAQYTFVENPLVRRFGRHTGPARGRGTDSVVGLRPQGGTQEGDPSRPRK